MNMQSFDEDGKPVLHFPLVRYKKSQPKWRKVSSSSLTDHRIDCDELGSFAITVNRNERYFLPNHIKLPYLVMPQHQRGDGSLNWDLNAGNAEPNKAPTIVFNGRKNLDYTLLWICHNLDKVRQGGTEPRLGCDFVAHCLSLSKVANSCRSNTPWSLRVCLYRGTYYICLAKPAHGRPENFVQLTSWGSNLVQYLTSADGKQPAQAHRPSLGHPRQNAAEKRDETTENFSVVMTRLTAMGRSENKTNSILIQNNVEAIDNDNATVVDDRRSKAAGATGEVTTSSPITQRYVNLCMGLLDPVDVGSKDEFKLKCYRASKWWFRASIVGITRVVCAFRDYDGLVHSVRSFSPAELIDYSEDADPGDRREVVSLESFLDFVRRTVTEDSADKEFVFSFDPITREVTCVPSSPADDGAEDRMIPRWYCEFLDENM